MTKRKNQSLESVRSFIVSLMNREQDNHARLTTSLQSIIGNTSEAEEAVKVSKCVYDAKIDLLEKILKKIGELS